MIEFLKKLLSDDGKSVPLDCASASETGLVRAENQDSVLVREDADVYCVADGMGGGDGGAVASALMCRAVDKEVVSSLDLQGRMKAMAAAVHEANAEIQDYALKAGYRQMATTVAMMALRLDDEPTAVIGHVGDSRVYRCRAGKLSALTADHTVAAEINRRSAATGKDEVVTGRLTHVLTRAVGIGDVEAEWKKVDVEPGDVFMLCSDGVYDMVPDGRIEEVLATASSAKAAVDRLSELIVAAGAEDNYTFVVIRVGTVAAQNGKDAKDAQAS